MARSWSKAKNYQNFLFKELSFKTLSSTVKLGKNSYDTNLQHIFHPVSEVDFENFDFGLEKDHQFEYPNR